MSEGRFTTVARELAAGANVTLFTVGTSMQPLLYERQTHVMLSPPHTFSGGDILLYLRPNGQYVLHRCIKRRGDICYMRGDHTYGLEKISAPSVIGVVTHIYRKNKLFSVKESMPYRIYVRLWCLCYPMRWLWMRLRCICGSVWRTVFKKKGNT